MEILQQAHMGHRNEEQGPRQRSAWEIISTISNNRFAPIQRFLSNLFKILINLTPLLSPPISLLRRPLIHHFTQDTAVCSHQLSH